MSFGRQRGFNFLDKLAPIPMRRVTQPSSGSSVDSLLQQFGRRGNSGGNRMSTNIPQFGGRGASGRSYFGNNLDNLLGDFTNRKMTPSTKLPMELALENPSTTISGQQGSYGGSNPALSGTTQWDDLINRVSKESGVPPEVLRSIMAIESQGQNLAANQAGAMGLMQVVPEYWQTTANAYGGDLMDPYTNIRTAAEVLKQGYSGYGNSWDNAAAFYFGGGGAFNADGTFTTDPDYDDDFGTSVAAYVGRFQENMAAIEQGSWADTVVGAVGGAIDVARQFIGQPYVWGGANPQQGFDCSGLTQWSLGQVGIQIPRTAQQQFDSMAKINGAQAQAGDLVFFHSTAPGDYISHVGIYLGNGKMLHAGSNGVVIADLNTDYWQQHMAGFGRAG